MDAYKHVNNTAYLRYIEQARIEMFAVGTADTDGFRWAPDRIVIAALDIDYRRPLTFRPEPIQVVSSVTRVGRSSFDLSQRIVDGDTVHAEATATIVAVGGAFGRSRPLEDVERAWLDAHAGPAPQRRRPAVPTAAGPVPPRHEIALDRRWADLDVNGHLNNVVYAIYLQEARAHLFALHDADGRAPLVRGLVVVRMHIDWLRPLAYRPEPLRAHTWFSAVAGATVTVHCELYDGGDLACRGVTTLALFDFEADRPRRITPDERAELERYLVRTEQAGA